MNQMFLLMIIHPINVFESVKRQTIYLEMSKALELLYLIIIGT